VCVCVCVYVCVYEEKWILQANIQTNEKSTNKLGPTTKTKREERERGERKNGF
jgi:hypothetical protein